MYQRDEIVTTKQLAAAWKVTEQHLCNQRTSGDGPPYFNIGRSVRYVWGDCEDYRRARMRCSTSEAKEAA